MFTFFQAHLVKSLNYQTAYHQGFLKSLISNKKATISSWNAFWRPILYQRSPGMFTSTFFREINFTKKNFVKLIYNSMFVYIFLCSFTTGTGKIRSSKKIPGSLGNVKKAKRTDFC